MKKVAVGIVAILSLVFLQPVNAEPNKSIVIIDTAIDSSIPQLKSRLVQEVCILGSMVCPNGQRFQEGVGAATLPSTQARSGGFEHGTIMSLIANKVNPDIDIIFVRIAGVLKNGKMDTYSITEITKALTWVVQNKQKYNIVSVSASMGNHNLGAGLNYCPIRATHKELISNIDTLVGLGVPTMFAAGNGRDYLRIDFPACIPQAVAVSGTTEDNAISPFFNSAPQVDFYALGYFDTEIGRSVGTSASTAAFSAYWAKNYKGTYQSTYDYMKSISKNAVGRTTTTDSFVDILG
jgi:hypothetical protein